MKFISEDISKTQKVHICLIWDCASMKRDVWSLNWLLSGVVKTNFTDFIIKDGYEICNKYYNVMYCFQNIKLCKHALYNKYL